VYNEYRGKEIGLISDIEFSEALEKWRPKLSKMSSRFVPGYTQEELFQELCLKLIKCLEGYDPERHVASFHTYLHTALYRHLGLLGRNFLRNNLSYGAADNRAVEKLIGLADDKFAPRLAYVEDDSVFNHAKVSEEDSLSLHLEILGFVGAEVTLMEGICEGLNLEETARVFEASVEELEAVEKTVHQKIERLRRNASIETRG
jgi:DNA-directed RNA polymerase specialized sigma24 family protein